MKHQFVDQLQPGDKVDSVFVLSEKVLSQKRDGANYLNITLQDRTGTVKGVMWDKVDTVVGGIRSGDFVRIVGGVGEYRGVRQVVVREMTVHPADDIDPADYLPAGRHDADVLFKRLQHLCESFQNTRLRALMDAFFADAEFVKKFKTAPAAKQMHHAYIGGLLEHTLSMASLADKLAGHYQGIDRDLLITGAVLHDIGKTEEFEYRHKIDYSDAGRLLSHIVIGLQMIDEKIAAVDGFDAQTAMLVKHLVVSHHGSREFGSPEPPKTLEAVLLNHIDEIDSKINGIRDYMASEDDAEAWTGYHRLLQRHFYRGARDGE